MQSAGSVTCWIQELKAGEEQALEQLRRRYWPFLVGLAAKKLRGAGVRATDGEDVAQEAFWGFYRSFKAGRLPRLADRKDVLAVLTIIAVRKLANVIEREYRGKRGGPAAGESVLSFLAGSSGITRGLHRIEGHEPSPSEQLQAKETYEHFVNGLPDELRPIAEMMLAGQTHREIAKARGCAVRTIDRKVSMILAEWQKLAEASVSE